MKNLSKVLAVVLALVMALSMVSFAAYTDVADDANYAEAVSVLSSLDMLKGYEDGTFKPEGDITRAEFAMVVCRLLGYAATAEVPASYAPFNDVAANHWASGAIALAAQQGIVNGYGDGNFGPEDNVTYEQAIKMVVAALGYTIKAEANGGYPGGFQIVAAQAGILDGITDGKAGLPASRGVVAQLAYNALEVPMFAQTGFGDLVSYNYSNTLLLNRIDVAKVEATINGTAKTVTGLDADKVKIELGKQFAAKSEVSEADWYSRTESGIKPSIKDADITWETEVKATEDAIAAAEAYLDCRVEAYVKNPTSRNAKLIAIAPVDAGYSELVFAAEDVNKDETDLSVAKELAIYTDETKEDYEEYDVEIETVYLNGRKFDVAGATLAAAYDTPAEIFAKFVDDATNSEADFRLLDNEGEGVYKVAYITSYSDYVVKTVYAEDYELVTATPYIPAIYGAVYTNDNELGTLILDEEDENVVFEIIKDGAVISVADIAENDVLSVAGYVDGDGKLKFGTVIVNTQSVTGKVSELDKDNTIISIDGVEYPYNANIATAIANNEIFVTVETEFYINARGVISGYNAEVKTTNLKYGYATIAAKDGSRDFNIRLLDAEGAWNTYGTASKIYVNDDRTPLTDTMLATFATAVSGVVSDDELLLNKVVAYELNGEGEIKKIFTEDEAGIFEANATYAAADPAPKFNSISETIGTFIIPDSIVIFSVNSADATIDEDEVKVVGKEALVHFEAYNFTAYNVEDGEPAAILGDYITGRMDWNADFMVVSGKTEKANANDDLGVEITGLVNGEAVTFFVTDECAVAEFGGATITGADLKAGDVIMFTAENGDASQIVRVLAADTAKGYFTAKDATDIPDNVVLGTKTAGDVTYTYYLGYVAKLTTSGIVIKGDDTSATLSLKNAPAVTKVDFFAPSNKTVVEKANEGSFRADSGLANGAAARDNGDIVLVRATNGTLAESAVVFKDWD